jgi:cytoskeletal protein RodZ
MATVGEVLREAREQRRLTLTDIADATLINVEFLRAIEQGRTDVLPAAYVRAFIREYAAMVGIEPLSIMRKLDLESVDHSDQRVPPLPSPVGATSPKHSASEPSTDRPGQRSPGDGMSNHYALIATIAVCVGVAIVVLWNILGHDQPAVQQMQFQDVVKENERRAAPESSRSVATNTVKPAAALQRPLGDSLTLRITTSGPVWLKVTIDRQDYRLVQGRVYRADTTLILYAKNRFRVTSGNAGAVTLALNGRSLGTLGKPGRLAQGIEVNAAGATIPDSLFR